MTSIQKAVACAVVTEAIAVSFVALDRVYGMHSPTWRDTPMGMLHQTDYARWQKVTFCYRVAAVAHLPAHIVVSLVGILVGAALGFDGSKVFGQYTFGGPHPSWVLLGFVQLGLWFCFWFVAIYLSMRFSQRAQARVADLYR